MTADPERRIQDSENKGCRRMLHIRIENKTNQYGNRSIYSPDVRNCYCQPPSVASYHGSAMSIVTIRCQNYTTGNSRMVVAAEEDRVNHGRTRPIYEGMDNAVIVVIAAHRRRQGVTEGNYKGPVFCTWLKLTTRLTRLSANHRLEFHG